MKMLAVFSILPILIVIGGVQNAAASCSEEYSADYHSLYVADVDHPCPNSYTYADYDLYGSGNGDFDLYVLDTWKDTWYKSSASGYNEYLRVPIHCGYSHKVYVWTYSGYGKWSVCSPQVYFGEGFSRIADSQSAPDTASTNGAAEPEIVGRWKLTFDWGCDGSSDDDEIIFFSDGTFGDDDDPNDGEWGIDGQSVQWEHDESPNALYQGSIYGIYMSGTMSTNDGNHGCWTASKA